MQTIYPWQTEEWKTVRKQIEGATLPSAFLVTGNCGLGKLEFAKTISESVLCDAESGIACGKCRSCKLFLASSHPDFSLLESERNGGVIKVEQVRNVITVLAQKPQIGNYQVVIINSAPQLNLAASNALLKTLEEPFGKVLFILLANSSLSVAATINSRCQRITLCSPTEKQALAWFREQDSFQEGLAAKFRIALRLSENAPLKALELIETEQFDSYASVLRNILLLLQGSLSPVEFAAAAEGVETASFLDYMQFVFLDILRLKSDLSPEFIVNINVVEELREISKKFMLEKLLACLDKIAETRRFIDNNLNRLLLCEDLAIFCQGAVSC